MPEDPNLLFLWTDQQRWDTLGAYGNDRIETPNLDALADRGTVFERAYCTTPICSPSRSSIMTGKYPHTTGVTGNNIPLAPDAECLPELEGFEDYATGWIGKWHLGDEVFAGHGFDEWVATEDQYHPFYGDDRPDDAHSDYHDYLLERGYEPDRNDDGHEWFSREFVATEVPEEHSKPAFMADAAVDFVERHRDEPFVLHVMFLEPHDPYASPRDDQYDPDEVSLPDNAEHDGLDDQPLRYRFAREAIRRGLSRRPPDRMGVPPTEDDWREVISNYWGLVSLVDTHAGRILDALDDAGVRDDTVAVYTSDHGDMMGSHGLYTKMTQFEESVRVPLLLDLPGEDALDRVSAPVSQIDLLPTLLDAMGRPIPDGLQGHTWLPFLRGGELVEADVVVEWNGVNFHGMDGRRAVEAPERTRPGADPAVEGLMRDWGLDEDDLLHVMTDPARTIVTPDGWKLTYRRGGEHELYDLDADPGETENLAADRPDVVDELYGRIVDWQTRTRDPVYL